MPLGKTGQIVVYINDTEYDSYNYRCMKILNGIHTFDIGALVINGATDRTNITEGNKVKIMVGDNAFFTGVIEESTLGSYGQGIVKGMDTVLYRLKRRSVPQNVADVSYYQGKDLDYIIPRIISVNNDGSSPWIVTEGTVDTFGTNSLYVRGDNDNKANFLIKTVEPTYYDYYPSYGSDPYDDEVINVVTEKGGGVSKYTFDLDDNTSNVSVVNDKKQVDRMWNVITLAGYGDGINQIKSKIFHATINRTTLDEDITASDTGSKLVVDSSDLPASGNVWIGCEKVAYSAKADDTHITISTRGVAFFTGAGFPQEAYAHKKGSPVYDAQYTETSAQTGSSIDTYNGVVDKPLSEKSIIDQNTLDMTVSAILEEHRTTPRTIVLNVPDIEDIYYLPNTSVDEGSCSGTGIIKEMTEHDGCLFIAGQTAVQRYVYADDFLSIGRPHPTASTYSICSNDNNLYAGQSNGYVYRWDIGVTWTSCGQVNAGDVNTEALVSFNDNLYASSSSDKAIRRYDGGTTWTSIGVPNGSYKVTKLVVSDSSLYCIAGAGGVYKYAGGTTWTSISAFGDSVTDLTDYDGNLYCIEQLSGPLSYNTHKYVSGTTWTNIGSGSGINYVPKCGLSVMNGELHVVGRYVGAVVIEYTRIYRYDGGTTWTLVKEHGYNTGAVSGSLAYDDKIFYSHASVNNHMYSYRDSGIDIGDNVTVNSTDNGISNEVFKIQAIELRMNMGLEENKLYLSSYSPRLEQRVKSIEESTEVVSKYMQGSTVLFPVQNYENCDSSNYLDMRFYLPSEVIAINTVKLSFKLKGYRAYTSTTASGGGATSGASSTSTTASGGSSTPTTAGGSVGTGNDKAFEYILANTDSRSFVVTVPDVEYGSFIAHNFFMWYYDAGTGTTHYIKLYDATTSTNLVTGVFTQDGYEGNWVSTYLTTTNRIGNTMSYIVDNTSGNTGPRAGDEMELEIVTYGTHTHTVTIAAHTHGMEHTHSTPDHTHTMGYEIKVSTLTSPSVDVYVGEDGGSMTLKGTYTDVNNENVDITSLVKDIGVGKWVNVQFRPDKNMRIEANAYTQAFINSD